MSWFSKLFRRKPDPSTLNDAERFNYAVQHGCPICDHSPFEYCNGPRGGAGRNVWCTTCWTRFTLVTMPGWGLLGIVHEREGKQAAEGLGYVPT